MIDTSTIPAWIPRTSDGYLDTQWRARWSKTASTMYDHHTDLKWLLDHTAWRAGDGRMRGRRLREIADEHDPPLNERTVRYYYQRLRKQDLIVSVKTRFDAPKEYWPRFDRADISENMPIPRTGKPKSTNRQTYDDPETLDDATNRQELPHEPARLASSNRQDLYLDSTTTLKEETPKEEISLSPTTTTPATDAVEDVGVEREREEAMNGTGAEDRAGLDQAMPTVCIGCSRPLTSDAVVCCGVCVPDIVGAHWDTLQHLHPTRKAANDIYAWIHNRPKLYVDIGAQQHNDQSTP